MRRLIYLFSFLGILSLVAPIAYADSIQTFILTGDVSASYAADLGPISGSVAIDTTTGAIDSFSLSDAGFNTGLSLLVGAAWSNYSPEIEFGETWLVDNPSENFFASEDITLPVASLIGYSGGVICSAANPCAEYSFANYINRGGAEMLDGQLTPLGDPVLVAETVATPEPASLLLFGTGILFFAGISRHRLVHRDD